MPSYRSLRDNVGIKCPHCGTMQLPPGRETLDSWNCGHCFSGFVTIPMLANLVPRDLIEKLYRFRPNATQGRPCPLCSAPMQIAEVKEHGSQVALDVCRKCDLLWYDAGRIVQLVRLRSPSEIIDQLERVKRALAGIQSEREPARSAPSREPEAPAAAVPWGTISLFLLCALLTPLWVYRPGIAERLSFLPEAPFRGFGVTWITSLFLNRGFQIYAMLPFAVLGTYVERRMGTANLVRLFLVSGVVGRLAYLIGGRAEPATSGASAAIAGVAAYALLIFPYREWLFPKDRWKSPAGTVAAIAVVVFAVVSLHVIWDFYEVALGKVVHGSVSGVPGGSLMAGFLALIKTAWFRAHLSSAAVGLLWLAGESVAEPFKPRSDSPYERR